MVSQLRSCNFFKNTSLTGAMCLISTGPITFMLIYVFSPFFWASAAKSLSMCALTCILSVKAIIKTLLIGFSGSFSLFTQELIVLIEGLQEIIATTKLSATNNENNFVLFMIKF